MDSQNVQQDNLTIEKNQLSTEVMNTSESINNDSDQGSKSIIDENQIDQKSRLESMDEDPKRINLAVRTEDKDSRDIAKISSRPDKDNPTTSVIIAENHDEFSKKEQQQHARTVSCYQQNVKVEAQVIACDVKRSKKESEKPENKPKKSEESEKSPPSSVLGLLSSGSNKRMSLLTLDDFILPNSPETVQELPSSSSSNGTKRRINRALLDDSDDEDETPPPQKKEKKLPPDNGVSRLKPPPLKSPSLKPPPLRTPALKPPPLKSPKFLEHKVSPVKPETKVTMRRSSSQIKEVEKLKEREEKKKLEERWERYRLKEKEKLKEKMKEMEKLKHKEKMKELEKLKFKQKMKELEKLKYNEKILELERAKEKEKYRERQREKERLKEKLKEKERMKEKERIKEKEKSKEDERIREKEKNKEREREKENEKSKEQEKDKVKHKHIVPDWKNDEGIQAKVRAKFLKAHPEFDDIDEDILINPEWIHMPYPPIPRKTTQKVAVAKQFERGDKWDPKMFVDSGEKEEPYKPEKRNYRILGFKMSCGEVTKEGKFSTPRKVNVMSSDGKAPHFPQQPVARQNDDGSLELECYVEANPQPSVKWFYDNNEISASNRYKPEIRNENKGVFSAVLKILELADADAGAYRCCIVNPHGKGNANFNLKLTGFSSPTFVEKPQISSRDDGQVMVMEFRAKSILEPTFVWHRISPGQGDEIVANSDRVKSVLIREAGDVFYSALEIKEPTKEKDAGQFVCTAKNDSGKLTATFTVKFEVPEGAPSFTRKPQILQQTSAAGEPCILFDIGYTARLNPQVGWVSPKGKKMREGTRIKFGNKEEGNGNYTATLELTNYKAKDSGTYTCNIKNDAGEANVELTLNIEGPLDDGGDDSEA